MNKKERKHIEQFAETKLRTFKIGAVILLISLILVWYMPLMIMVVPVIVSIAMIAYGWNWRKYNNMLIEEEN